MSSKFINDDDIALALNDGDSSELESLTSEDDGWTDCEDDEEEEIIEERSINNNAVELVSDDEEVQPQHNPSRKLSFCLVFVMEITLTLMMLDLKVILEKNWKDISVNEI